MPFERAESNLLHQRLGESTRFITVVAGPRQVGKSTLVRNVLRRYPHSFVATDHPFDWQTFGGDASSSYGIPGEAPASEWIVQHWLRARAEAKALPEDQTYILAMDEIQKIPRWSEVVKGLWDADRAVGLNLHVILLGSSPWLMQKGLTESLAGRFETIAMSHWSYPEMQEAFDLSLEEYLYFGGYPGSAQLIGDEPRWRNYIRGTLIHPNIERDILQMNRVDKPALLKNLFELGCNYSGQIISYTKLMGQLQDAGNTVTLAHYLNLLGQAGLLRGLSKYAGEQHRQRSSSPKLNALNTSLISALSGYSFTEARADRSHWGRLVESAVGAHLCNSANDNCQVQYWRESPDEVDFVLHDGKGLLAIEVKSGKTFAKPKGLERFSSHYPHARTLIVGEGGVALAEFLTQPARYWLERT
ncbi:MAG: ATP-binding protein [Pseudomonas sp.]|uniref:ATP-binding protein n=1 Tax=Pseudomonas sp. TaxID=306 RepID=UPI002723A603|nr:ATP-binding protein [Pseudomonas sp.]MDO9619680.1 ATP-binding protein [Pseudomonas sp.]MDP2444487.1 ATP-binding protein [Pseudomonas sp.]MDZ4335594.1 ATP-binding protein [Pseudomonas sp.]